jgi:hypothetical protein
MTRKAVSGGIVLLAALGTAAAQWSTAVIGKGGAACDAAAEQTTAAPSLPIWRPPENAPHGVHEFDQSAKLVLPTATISVELWGGGGGGGAGSSGTYTEGGAGGGGGASGAYARASLTIMPGKTYTLIVGRGGAKGVRASRGEDHRAGPGQDGGDSLVCDGDTILLSAPGGAGGALARDNDHGGQGGKGRAIETRATTALTRTGSDGAAGAGPLFEFPGRGGKGGRPPAGSVAPAGGFGGSGGKGEDRPDGLSDGKPGAAGRIIVSW